MSRTELETLPRGTPVRLETRSGYRFQGMVNGTPGALARLGPFDEDPAFRCILEVDPARINLPTD